MSTTKSAKVLVLDDDPDLVQAIGEVLRGEGHEVITRVARSVDDVVSIKPDLVHVDCPPTASNEVLNFVQRLRMNRDVASIPIIIGASSLKDFEPEKLREQMIHVLLRPFEIDDLVSTVEELIDAGRNVRALGGGRKRRGNEQAG